GGDSQGEGLLATAVQPDVARELQLTPETVERLKAVVAQEGSGKSEQQGLELLTPLQQRHLRQISVRDQGMQSLRSDRVAQSLDLTAAQRAEVERQWQVAQETIDRRGAGARASA